MLGMGSLEVLWLQGAGISAGCCSRGWWQVFVSGVTGRVCGSVFLPRDPLLMLEGRTPVGAGKSSVSLTAGRPSVEVC